MRHNYTISTERNTMSNGGILSVYFNAFSSKSECETNIVNYYKQSCSIDFQHCSFTGKEPRKGKRIPLNKIKYNEQRDEETGYGYFGARYMDHELMTMWLSVDPMVDKYPSISPYAYCAWNPMKLVDPDGNDWVVIFDHENKTVTIEAQYAVNDNDAKKSAENAVKIWNNLSGDYSLMVGDDKYSVLFNLSVVDQSEADTQDPRFNTYQLVSALKDKGGDIDKKIVGKTNVRNISVLESEKDNYVTSSHEIGHSLGLPHLSGGLKGLMEEDGGRQSRHHEITKNNIESILNYALHPEQRDPNFQTGVGSYIEIGSASVNITKPRNLRLIKNHK